MTLTPNEAIRLIKKKGDVYVITRLTEDDTFKLKVIKSDVIALLSKFEKGAEIGCQFIPNSEGFLMDILLGW